MYNIDISILQPQNNLRILSILCNKWCFFTECFVCISDYNDNSCVYIHDQALMKTACPGGVITLLYLKHPIFFNLLYTTGAFTTYHWPLRWFTIYMYKHALYTTLSSRQCKFYKKLVQLNKIWICVILRKVSVTSVQSDRCIGGALTWISYIFDFSTSRLSADFISKLKT